MRTYVVGERVAARAIDPFPLGPSLDGDRTREGRHAGQAAIAEPIVPVLLIAGVVVPMDAWDHAGSRSIDA